jgi:hypothetical protein
LLAPRPTPKLEDHPLPSVRGCLFNLFTATLHQIGDYQVKKIINIYSYYIIIIIVIIIIIIIIIEFLTSQLQLRNIHLSWDT